MRIGNLTFEKINKNYHMLDAINPYCIAMYEHNKYGELDTIIVDLKTKIYCYSNDYFDVISNPEDYTWLRLAE